MTTEYQQLRREAMQTVWEMLALTKGQIDPNKILRLGEFFGTKADEPQEPIGEGLAQLRKALMLHEKYKTNVRAWTQGYKDYLAERLIEATKVNDAYREAAIILLEKEPQL